MPKTLLIFAFVTLPVFTIFAEPYDFYPEDFRGEWSVEILFEIPPEGVDSNSEFEESIFDTMTFSFLGEGKAVLRSGDGDELAVTWSANEYVLTIEFPADGDFQYVANYRYAALDFGTVIITMFDLFNYPQVGIMNRTAVAF